MKFLFLSLIRIYQFTISPVIPKCCRFYPSCSDYGLEAIRKHGPFKGTFLLLKRLLKCGPWHLGGIDEVP